jgi:hypothetical protein
MYFKITKTIIIMAWINNLHKNQINIVYYVIVYNLLKYYMIQISLTFKMYYQKNILIQ